MSQKVGLAHCAQRQNGYHLPGMDGTLQRACSEQTAREIEEEVKTSLDRCYAEAKAILQAHREQLDLVAEELLKRETLDRSGFYKLIGKPEPKDELRVAPLPHPLETESGR